jgi:hypothetical protein
MGLTFGTGVHGEAHLPRGYVDASWAEDVPTRRSHTGYALMVGNAAVKWHSKQQSTVALSSTEAEYTALAAAVQAALGLQNLLRVLWPDACTTMMLNEDNQSTIRQALNLQSSESTKHVDVKLHFLKQHVATGAIKLQYIATAEQPADSLTKNLERVKVSLFRQILLGHQYGPALV